MSSHSLYLRFDHPKKDPEALHTLKIYYIDPSGNKKQRKTDIKLQPIHWDDKLRRIDSRYAKMTMYQQKHKRILELENQLHDAIFDLRKGATFESVMQKIFVEQNSELTLREFINKTNELSDKNKIRYYNEIKGIEKHCGIDNLRCSVLSDRNTILKIKDALMKSDLGNGKYNYMSSLKTLSNILGYDSSTIFKNAIPKKIKEDIEPVEYNQLMSGIGKINTVGQLSSYLLWLYSFCLKSVTGSDIPNIDLDSLVFEDDNEQTNHYHSLGDIIRSEDPSISFTKKIWWKDNRKKSTVPIKGLVNAFPTLFIRDWLHYCVKTATPQFAYTGDDPIRIFNFYTLKKNKQEDVDGLEKWNRYRHTPKQNLEKLINSGLHAARQTYTAQMEDLGKNGFEMDRQLGHNVSKGALKNYAGTGLRYKEDATQNQVINEFDIVGIVEMLLKAFMYKKDMYGKLFFPMDLEEGIIDGKPANKKIIKDRKLYKSKIIFDLLKTVETNSKWSNKDEAEYNMLLSKEIKKGKWEWDDQKGETVKREFSEKDYEGRLKELHELRKKIFKLKPYKIVKSKAGLISFELVDKSDLTNTDPNEKNFFVEQELLGKSEEIFK